MEKNRDIFVKHLTIKKIDEEKRMVYGWASTSDIDSDGEIIKVEAMERALPEYLKFPALREMHQPSAVGTTKEAEIDKKKGLYIGAKVVDNDAWEKVKEGVYPAFSIGGNVLKRVGNVIQDIELVEISLVDVPANKSAVIELWKSAGQKDFKKNAETAYSMANLMINIKDKIWYWDYMGKDTADLKAMLETAKKLVAQEASEAEDYGDDEGESLFWGGSTSLQIKKKIHVLEQMSFPNNPYAETIRKGVIKSMSEEEKKKKDAEDAAAAKKKADDEATAAAAGDTTGEQPAEKGALAQALEKLNKAGDAILKSTEKKEGAAEEVIEKALNSVTATLEKVAKKFEDFEARLVAIEGQPAAPKSRSIVAEKTITGGDTTKKEEPTGRLAEIAKELADLTKIYEAIGANEFAKQGHSTKATKLQAEQSELMRKEAAKA